MEKHFSQLYQDAVTLLHNLTTSKGILASTIEADNYKRIWARDSMVCGIAGLWMKDEIVIKGLQNSLLILAKSQNELGMIPSNVLPNGTDASFGSLVGRIDANTWFILGACLYLIETEDKATWQILKPAIEKCRTFLKASEFNNKGWIYTPLSGNWADEYPIHGYTLYDNMLRIWGEKLFLKIEGKRTSSMQAILKKTEANFWPSETTEASLIYQKPAFEKALQKKQKHFGAFILPGNYDLRFDAAANALAMLQLNLKDSQKKSLSTFIKTLPNHLIPAFWPIISEKSDDWNLLEGNYSFTFKNHPGDFHNGGIWPVWMGLFCLGLAKNGMNKEVKKMVVSFSETVRENPHWDFQEYFNAKTLLVGGKTKMGYTAAGIVFMKLAMETS
ncbi:MAG: glycoside hydrolase 100 family protein [Flavobacteriaceae bacterium]